MKCREGHGAPAVCWSPLFSRFVIERRLTMSAREYVGDLSTSSAILNCGPRSKSSDLADHASLLSRSEMPQTSPSISAWRCQQ